MSTAASRYDLVGKDDLIGRYLADGKNVDDIPDHELTEYLRYDLCLTYVIARYQILEARARGMFRLILTQCQATMALANMEYNGIQVCPATLAGTLAQAKATIAGSESSFRTLAGVCGEGRPDLLRSFTDNTGPTWPRNLSLSKTSLIQAMIYGGEYEYEWAYRKSPASKRNSVHKETVKYEPLFRGTTTPAMRTKGGDLSVSDEALEEISKLSSSLSPSQTSLVILLRDCRLAEKIESTYVHGITSNTFNWKLHGSINQVTTDTGRLSSSSPNLQNFPNETTYGLKDCFVSRFPGGKLVEADFKQVEVVALAYLVGPGKLREAVCRGEDIHENTARIVYGRLPSPAEKRLIKGVNFGLIYGGGAAAISAQTGVMESVVKTVMKAFYHLYPEVAAWQKDIVEMVGRDTRVFGSITGHSKKAVPIKTFMATYNAISPAGIGRCYVFTEGDNPHANAKWAAATKQHAVNVKPTVIKNYPVQGLATGDIVPMVLGNLWRRLMRNKDWYAHIKLVNTVHDSFLMDVHPDFVDVAVKLANDCIKNTPELLEKTYGINDWELPVKCEIKVGPNWGNLTKVEI
jgi:DNA polymerase I-like protein with 3'-5' exonuclease and polymerase domains